MADMSNLTIKRMPVLLYFHPSMKSLAKQIVSLCQSSDDTKKKKAVKREVEYCDDISWKFTDDEFPDIYVTDERRMAGKDVLYLGSFHSPDVILEQLPVLFSFPRFLAKSFTFILPYLPGSNNSKEHDEGHLSTVKTLTTVLSSIPLTAKGPAQIIMFDIHSIPQRHYFSQNVAPRLESGIPLLLSEIEDMFGSAMNVTYAFPDELALKRFGHHFDEENIIICNKVRDGNRKLVTVKGNPKEKDIVIIDDQVITGQNFIACMKALKAGGAKSVSGYVTHAIFPEENWRRFLEEENRLAHFWITDSIPHAHRICRYKPFKLLSIGVAISDMLQGYDLLL